ncbi:site-specific integrase [Labrys neptuniae]
MPRPSKGARLVYRADRDLWIIRDGQKERGTGCPKQDRAGAEAKFKDYLAEKHEPNFGVGNPDQVSIVDALALYAKEHAPTVARPDVILSSVSHLGEFWAGKVVGQITKRTCREYLTWRCAQPDARYTKDPDNAPRVGDQTVRRELEDLRSALHFAKGENLLRYVPDVHLPDKAEARERWLTRDEAAHLLWAAWKPCWGKTKPANMKPENWQELKFKSRHLARFILVALYTGTRKDAIFKLRWISSTEGGWVDLARGLIYRRGIGQRQTNKKKTPIPISERLLPHLRRWKDRSTLNVIEFEGSPVSSIKRSWATAVGHAGLSDDVVPHVLRHTFATWAMQAGQPIPLVAGALGTSEKIVRDVYGHHHPDFLRDVVNSVGGRK